MLITCAGDKFYFFQRNHPFGSNRLAHPGLNHLRTHSQAPRRNSPLAEVNHGVKGAESREVIIIPFPLLLLTVSSTWKGPRVRPRSRPTRGDTRPSTGHFTWSSAWRGGWGGRGGVHRGNGWKYEGKGPIMVSTDFSLTPWGNLESSINQMIEEEKKKTWKKCMLLKKEINYSGSERPGAQSLTRSH